MEGQRVFGSRVYCTNPFCKNCNPDGKSVKEEGDGTGGIRKDDQNSRRTSKLLFDSVTRLILSNQRDR